MPTISPVVVSPNSNSAPSTNCIPGGGGVLPVQPPVPLTVAPQVIGFVPLFQCYPVDCREGLYTADIIADDQNFVLPVFADVADDDPYKNDYNSWLVSFPTGYNAIQAGAFQLQRYDNVGSPGIDPQVLATIVLTGSPEATPNVAIYINNMSPSLGSTDWNTNLNTTMGYFDGTTNGFQMNWITASGCMVVQAPLGTGSNWNGSSVTIEFSNMSEGETITINNTVYTASAAGTIYWISNFAGGVNATPEGEWSSIAVLNNTTFGTPYSNNFCNPQTKTIPAVPEVPATAKLTNTYTSTAGKLATATVEWEEVSAPGTFNAQVKIYTPSLAYTYSCINQTSAVSAMQNIIGQVNGGPSGFSMAITPSVNTVYPYGQNLTMTCPAGTGATPNSGWYWTYGDQSIPTYFDVGDFEGGANGSGGSGTITYTFSNGIYNFTVSSSASPLSAALSAIAADINNPSTGYGFSSNSNASVITAPAGFGSQPNNTWKITVTATGYTQNVNPYSITFQSGVNAIPAQTITTGGTCSNFNYQGYELDWQAVLSNFGPGTYRMYVNGSFTALYHYCMASPPFCLQQWSCLGSTNTVRFESTYNGGTFGSVSQNQQGTTWALCCTCNTPGANGTASSCSTVPIQWADSIRFSGMFGYKTYEFQRDTIKYATGIIYKVRDEVIKKFTCKSDRMPDWFLDRFAAYGLQADFLYVSDYNINNADYNIKHYWVIADSNLSPKYLNYSRYQKFLDLTFMEGQQDIYRDRCCSGCGTTGVGSVSVPSIPPL